MCVARGHGWQGACMAEGEMHGRGACVCVCGGGGGVMRAGETATEAGGTHPTGMHSCSR